MEWASRSAECRCNWSSAAYKLLISSPKLEDVDVHVPHASSVAESLSGAQLGNHSYGHEPVALSLNQTYFTLTCAYQISKQRPVGSVCRYSLRAAQLRAVAAEGCASL